MPDKATIPPLFHRNKFWKFKLSSHIAYFPTTHTGKMLTLAPGS